jgi:hypothetical protein
MDDQWNPAAEEQRMIDEYNQQFRPEPYRQIFYSPSSEGWRVDASFPDGFFQAANVLLAGIIDGTLREGIEGIPAVFLSRHYLELALKYALFHSRWLADERHNAPAVEPIPPGHSLKHYWDKLTSELKAKAIAAPKGLDLQFVHKMVLEFEQYDPSNWRFRYPAKQIAVASGPTEFFSIGIDFAALRFNLQRAHDVLETLDFYLLNTYGENEDWESEQNSW